MLGNTRCAVHTRRPVHESTSRLSNVPQQEHNEALDVREGVSQKARIVQGMHKSNRLGQQDLLMRGTLTFHAAFSSTSVCSPHMASRLWICSTSPVPAYASVCSTTWAYWEICFGKVLATYSHMPQSVTSGL